MKRWYEVGYKPKTNPYRLRDDSTSEQDLDTFQRMSVIADALAAELNHAERLYADLREYTGRIESNYAGCADSRRTLTVRLRREKLAREKAEAEVERLREECAMRRQYEKWLREERDKLIIAMKDIVAIWEANEGTAEEDGERMKSIAEEVSDKWEI